MQRSIKKNKQTSVNLTRKIKRFNLILKIIVDKKVSKCPFKKINIYRHADKKNTIYFGEDVVLNGKISLNNGFW